MGRLAVLGGAVLLVVLAQQGRAESPPPVAVEAAHVEVATIADTVSAVGSLRSNEAVIIRPEIAGRIESIHFQEGAPVEQGALLFKIDDVVARAELAEAEANLALSERNYQRAQELYRKGAGTGRSLDESKASLDSDRAKVALYRARLEKTRIVAPFSGILGLRRVSVGDFVVIGQDLVNLENITPIKVDFRVPERYLGEVKTGQKLTVEVDAFAGRSFEGQVLAVDPQIDAGGRSIAIRATIANREQLLRPGLFARINLILNVRPQALVVPEQAIVPRGDDRFVYKIVDGKAVATRVTLGQRQPGRVEVVKGLAPGDLVVTAGHLKIRDGTPVTVSQPPPAAAAGPRS